MGKRVKREDAHCGRCGAESAWINGDPKGSPSCDCVENLAEIAKLRAEVAAERFSRVGVESAYELLAIQSASVVRELQRTERDLAAARAALDGEREALSTAQRALANISGCGGCENCGDIASAAFANTMRRHANDAAMDARQ